MKIAYCSDLHLEFADLTLTNENQADVLVLAGDICVAKHLHTKEVFLNFFQRVSKEFPKVLYVIGNHEHYHYLFNDTVADIVDALSHLPNIHVLDNETITIDDITFVGGTMWTNMNEEDPMTIGAVTDFMPDWRIIKYFDGVNYRKYTPQLSIQEFDRTVQYINIVTSGKDKKYVVITHHSPSFQSCHEKWSGDIGNGAFHTNLDEFITYRPQIKAWIHGHTHDPCEYEISTTRIACNPRGYPKEGQHGQFQLKYMEII